MERSDSLILTMKDNFIRLRHGMTKRIQLDFAYWQLFRLFNVFVLCLALAAWGGYKLASRQDKRDLGSVAQVWQHYLAVDRDELKEIKSDTEKQLEVLTQHLGRIDANLMRINALGERLVSFVHLDPAEFNFNQDDVPLALEKYKGRATLASTLKELDLILDKRYAQMNAIHLALMTQLGQRELSFSGAGKPVAKGWISSFFGHREDPFSKNRAWHAGVDIVGNEGDEIKALAGGVVSYADHKGAYGQMVEINHGNGLATRYGHNKALLVRPGELVRKGQAIALLGSTGRSTGPHVHLEVHKNGEPVDPGHYFPDLKRK